MAATVPYRVASTPETPAPIPQQLVYESVDRDRPRVLVNRWAIAIGVVMVVAMLRVGSWLGIWFGALFVGFSVRSALKSARERISLRIEEGVLVVSRPGKPDERVWFDSLTDVALDTRSIQEVQRNTSLASATVGTTLAPRVDVGRIVLVCDWGDDEPHRIPLGERESAHMDLVAWASKIRTFLRANGWLPLDERE